MTIVRTLEVFDACGELTPLHWAALCNYKKNALQLLRTGADVDTDAQRTPLISENLPAEIQHFIRQRLKTKELAQRITPLSLALVSKRPEIVTTLLEAGATPGDDKARIQDIIAPPEDDPPRMLRGMLAAGMELGEEVRHGHHDPFHQTDGYLEQVLRDSR